jgi:hypothetical protein
LPRKFEEQIACSLTSDPRSRNAGAAHRVFSDDNAARSKVNTLKVTDEGTPPCSKREVRQSDNHLRCFRYLLNLAAAEFVCITINMTKNTFLDKEEEITSFQPHQAD